MHGGECFLLTFVVAWCAWRGGLLPLKSPPTDYATVHLKFKDLKKTSSDGRELTFLLIAEPPLKFRNFKATGNGEMGMMLSWERATQIEQAFDGYTMYVFMKNVPIDTAPHRIDEAEYHLIIRANPEDSFHSLPIKYAFDPKAEKPSIRVSRRDIKESESRAAGISSGRA